MNVFIVGGNNELIKSFNVTKTWKLQGNNDHNSLCPSDEKGNKSPMVKQSTDYLFARQLSEEMESTIARIQPG
jgi:hypothetical protein